MPHFIFKIDETVFPLNNVPPEIVITKGIRDVINFTSSEKGKNVTIVACCSSSGALIPPFVIFKWVSRKYTSGFYLQDLKSQ